MATRAVVSVVSRRSCRDASQHESRYRRVRQVGGDMSRWAGAAAWWARQAVVWSTQLNLFQRAAPIE